MGSDDFKKSFGRKDGDVGFEVSVRKRFEASLVAVFNGGFEPLNFVTGVIVNVPGFPVGGDEDVRDRELGEFGGFWREVVFMDPEQNRV